MSYIFNELTYRSFLNISATWELRINEYTSSIESIRVLRDVSHPYIVLITSELLSDLCIILENLTVNCAVKLSPKQFILILFSFPNRSVSFGWNFKDTWTIIYKLKIYYNFLTVSNLKLTERLKRFLSVFMNNLSFAFRKIN